MWYLVALAGAGQVAVSVAPLRVTVMLAGVEGGDDCPCASDWASAPPACDCATGVGVGRRASPSAGGCAGMQA